MSKEAPPPYDARPPGFVADPGQGMYPPLPQGQYPPGQYGPPPTQHAGPPPSHHAGPSPNPPQHTVIVTTTTAPAMLGPQPVHTFCPHCHANITTSVETEANTKTHLFALLLCVFGCWPCCCIPYCMDSCQSKKHFCPNCKAYLGTYSD